MERLGLGLPKEAIYKQFIPKNEFYRHGEFKKADQRAFIEGIERITLYSQLTRENTNVAEYKDEERHYREISIIIVELRDKAFMDNIANLIMTSIPYPMLLIGIYGEEIIFYTAHHRENKADKNRTVLGYIYNTGFMEMDSPFIEDISYENLNKQNLYTLYDSYVQAILSYNLEKRNIKSFENREEVFKEVNRIEEEIAEFRSRLKSEKHFNKQMDLNIEIKRLEKKLKDLEG